jgi:hypothetical protein
VDRGIENPPDRQQTAIFEKFRQRDGSNAIGKGSAFRMELPVRAPAAAGTNLSKRTLIVEFVGRSARFPPPSGNTVGVAGQIKTPRGGAGCRSLR